MAVLTFSPNCGHAPVRLPHPCLVLCCGTAAVVSEEEWYFGIKEVIMAERRSEFGKEKYPSDEQIQKRAHEIYTKRGGQDGRALDDWLAAEEELKQDSKNR